MKTTATLILLSALGMQSMAQQTITASWMPVVGTVYKIQMADSTGVGHGASGTNATWDYSSLTAVGSEMNMEFMSPSGKPDASSFPNANLAVFMTSDEGDTSWQYIETNSYQYNMHGYSSDLGVMVFSDPLTAMLFPINPGGTMATDNFSGMATSGLDKVVRNGSYSIVSDGMGTLTLSGGTFSSVHKMKAIRTYTDSLFIAGNFIGLNNYTSTRYFWITNNVKQILLNIEYVDGDMVTGKQVYYYKGANTQGIEGVDVVAVKVFPNPVSGKLYLAVDELDGQYFQAEVLDMKGAVVYSSTIDKSSAMIDVAGMVKGVYFLNLVDENGKRASAKFVVE
jgi:hypothetical protein